MTDGGPKRARGGEGCESIEGGYSIFLDREAIQSFMESGDFSSARELDHFKEVETQVEKWLKEGEGVSLLALSVSENTLPRDFTVLQVAHLMAKHGKTVLIVDVDFLHPGMSGLVDRPDDYGFLDLFLYGSSLKSIFHPTGIDGVSVAGPGSFPVSKTVPFAIKEFSKNADFLARRADAVIYCSTLYTDEGEINPLCREVGGIVLSCRIEETAEGQLRKVLADLGPDVPPVDLICFCEKKPEARAVAAAVRPAAERESAAPAVERGAREIEEKRAAAGEPHPAYLEKTEEIEEPVRSGGARINVPRLAVIVAAVLVVSFVAWWLVTDRSIRQRREASTMTELVQKQREVRGETAGRGTEGAETETGVGSDSALAAARSAGVDSVGAAPPVGVPVPPPEQTAAVAETTGLAPREVRPPLPRDTTVGAEAAAHGEPAALTGGRYVVHVASFKNLTRAGREKELLEAKGFVVSIVEVELKGEQWFRVLVGGYATREEAIRARSELMDRAGVGYANIIDLEKRE